MTNDDDAEPSLVLMASAGRRGIGVASIGGLGGILLWFAASQNPEPLWQAAMVAMGVGALWMARRMWRATAASLVLTPRALKSSDGRVLAEMEDIVAVARGAFAFKPSNGFTLTLRKPGPFVWEPGLWWRLGRRVGVGGVTPGTPARFMAELMQERIAKRSGE
ncbi:hypothetical protein ABIE58_000667 [Roseovarius sp. MBR-78]|uniref:hypothetical protein n=1 Tax=Roseovarius sp. MBR-78 TaxID=3156460 RepID=UPI00339AC133